MHDENTRTNHSVAHPINCNKINICLCMEHVEQDCFLKYLLNAYLVIFFLHFLSLRVITLDIEIYLAFKENFLSFPTANVATCVFKDRKMTNFGIYFKNFKFVFKSLLNEKSQMETY